MTTAMADLKDELRRIPSLKAPLPDMDFSAFPQTPHQAFAIWLQEALEAGVREPHAMTLSTCDENGWPDARVLILKNLDERGWHFAIKAESPKARQIATEPNVALTFYWPALGRQIRLRGPAALLPAEECAADYSERPQGSRASALASQQSAVLSDVTELTRKLAEADAFLIANPDFVAPGWQVYAVAPIVVEFWQGASDRNHKRLRFKLSSDQSEWERVRLWP
ncbi:pyridoxal 5'-phosphate synthase [Agrobacterium sp. T29]|uniref:pyridoxine/pyridoxamine 5'-phosphate oxidase n=1 Tax=Agrobacterium sp. T29 TaxID=2580515 RepID=UPI00115D6291|nr:pyridoxal 5'-phosphate synthase [Agrobacterium sp. T29]